MCPMFSPHSPNPFYLFNRVHAYELEGHGILINVMLVDDVDLLAGTGW